jgi:hypothetical protein
VWNGSGAVRSKVRKRWEDESEERWDAMCSVTLSFIGAAGNNVMIHFLRKKMSFYFNHPRDPDAGSRNRKGGKFKRF